MNTKVTYNFYWFILFLNLFILSCATQKNVIKPVDTNMGPRIFLTAETHNGDFLNDPYLRGDSSLDKADQFCNTSVSKPNDSYYKALLYSQTIRDPKHHTTWPLKSKTTYHRIDGKSVIGITNDNAIFDVTWRELINPVDQLKKAKVFTGIPNSTTSSTKINKSNCKDWSSHETNNLGKSGLSNYTDEHAFSLPGATSCAQKLHIYCVEQAQEN